MRLRGEPGDSLAFTETERIFKKAQKQQDCKPAQNFGITRPPSDLAAISDTANPPQTPHGHCHFRNVSPSQ